ncbi:ACP S-malonyltransferase [Actinokineospora sp.]|uniref:ACP S-malonyltransferase n=1 Tax=Actinokineospora sp. TaxID=1872133 RepID=UPI004037809B
MSLTAVVFPGMGATTFADVGRYMVLDRYARARVAAADEVLGESLLAGFRAERDGYGVLSQVAFMVNSLALADRAEQELGLRPDICAGPCFGQRALTAYVGALDFADAIRLTVELSGVEDDYFAAEPEDLVTQCFVRVPDEPFRAMVEGFVAGGEWLEISGHLDRGAYLVSMRAALLDTVIRGVRDLGGYTMQTMRPPVHASRFGALRRRAEAEVLSRYRLADPRLPVIADQDGRLVRTADELRTMLLDTFDRPIDWPAAVSTLAGHGVRTAYFTGPDMMFHRLDCSAAAFRVVPVTPKTVSRPVAVRR